MKRFIVGLAATAILSMPMAASALEKMDNSQLRSATGQAGVSIAIDDIVIYQKSLADTTYWDTDGMADGFGAAGITIDHAEAMEKLMIIDGILDGEKYGTAKLTETFGTTNVGIISQADLATFKQQNIASLVASGAFDVSTIVGGYLQDPANSATATTYQTNVGIINNTSSTEDQIATAKAENAEIVGLALAADPDGVAAAYETQITDSDDESLEAYKTGYNKAIFDATNGNTANDDYRTGISPLTIDVGTCEALTAGWKYNMGGDTADLAKIGAVGGVVIGLPTIEITTYNTNTFKTVKLAVGTHCCPK